MKEMEVTGESKNIVSDNVSKLKEIFPEVVTYRTFRSGGKQTS